MAGDRLTVPLVPRRRLIGLPFGAVQSLRRGSGFDVAGARPYRPGDPVDAIDWKGSARLSSARDDDEFIVREHHAEEAPRVAVVVDRRPGMALFPDGYPWLSKPRAVRAALDLVAASAHAAHGLVGYLDVTGAGTTWLPPRSRRELADLEDRLDAAPFDAPSDALSVALEHLLLLRADLPAGSFVFVLSDFLADAEHATWERAAERRWELVPVIVQDPVWEQSFPAVDGIVAPVVDPARRRVTYVRLSADEVAARREGNAARLERLVRRFEELDARPVVLGVDDRERVHQAFLDWAERRSRERSRAW